LLPTIHLSGQMPNRLSWLFGTLAAQHWRSAQMLPMRQSISSLIMATTASTPRTVDRLEKPPAWTDSLQPQRIRLPRQRARSSLA
jgi:hypothetical protein